MDKFLSDFPKARVPYLEPSPIFNRGPDPVAHELLRFLRRDSLQLHGAQARL